MAGRIAAILPRREVLHFDPDGENKASSWKKYSLPAAYIDAYAACPGHLSRQGAGTGGPTSRAMTEIKLQYVNVNAGWYKRSER